MNRHFAHMSQVMQHYIIWHTYRRSHHVFRQIPSLPPQTHSIETRHYSEKLIQTHGRVTPDFRKSCFSELTTLWRIDGNLKAISSGTVSYLTMQLIWSMSRQQNGNLILSYPVDIYPLSANHDLQTTLSKHVFHYFLWKIRNKNRLSSALEFSLVL